MSIKDKTLELNNWAVVGATNKRERYGYKIVKILEDNDYSVFPVNPNQEEVAGLKCYDSILDIPVEIEVVDLVVKPEIGQQILEQVNQAGVEYVWLQPGTRSEAVRKIARKYGLQLVEDCIYATLK